ncbi:MAG: hypothetical protein NZ805_13980 [Armatimonadetes bacterium]|nr:hypothetical protein [Armatimonadota bacterium]
MRTWLILVGVVLVALTLAPLQTQQVFQFRLPVISDDGSEVLYQAIPVTAGQPTLDVFQMPPNAMTTLGMRLFLNGIPIVLPGQFQDAARPHFSVSQGFHIVYMRGGNGTPLQVFLYDRQKGQEILISGIGGNPGTNHSVCPRVNKNGRVILFVSLDQGLHDPDGDGNPNPLPTYATPTTTAQWIIYVHDRDLDGNSVYDEPPDPLTGQPKVATFAVAVASSPYVALSLDTGGTYIAYQVYNPSTRIWGLFVKDWRNNIFTDPPIAVSPVAFSAPSVIGIVQPVSGALVAFTANTAFNGNRAGVWLAEVDFSLSTPLATLRPISLNNGVNGAPVISPDASALAFHTTASDIVMPNLSDRNGVDDIYVFDLVTLTPIWSTLMVRNLLAGPLPPVGTFDPCVHPSLSSLVGNNMFIAFEHWLRNPATGQSQIIIRKAQIQPTSNLLFSLRPGRARRYVPMR